MPCDLFRLELWNITRTLSNRRCRLRVVVERENSCCRVANEPITVKRCGLLIVAVSSSIKVKLNMSDESPEKDGYAKADLSFEPEDQDEHSGDTKRKRSEDLEESPNEFKKNRSESPDRAGRIESQSAPMTAYTAVDALGQAAISAGSYHAAAVAESSEIITEMSEISQEKVGQVIGSKGAIIQDLQARSSCKIQVNQDFPPGAPRQVVYTGTRAQVKAAKDLISLILDKGPTAIHMLNGPVVTQVVECAQPLVGRVIGTGGCNIRDIQLRCGVKIQVHQDFPENVPRQVEITGNQQAVQAAALCVRQIIDGTSQGVGMLGVGPMGPMGGMGGMMPMGGAPGGVSVVNGVHIVECAKQYVGRIIGRAGETINVLQAKSGARVQIDQKVPDGMPCKVNISGAPDCVNLAVQMVQEIISQGPNRLAMYPNYQPAYGGGQMGYGAPAAVGYYGAPQMGGYNGGYGAPAAGAGAYYQQQQQPQGGAAGYYQQQGAYQQQQPAARAAPAATSASPWTEHKTDDGISYWYNASTGVSQVIFFIL